MSTIDDALLSAYLDGELAGPDLAAVEAALASQPAVGKRLATLRLVNELTRGHASSIDSIPLPAHIAQLITAADTAPKQRSARLLSFPLKVRVLLPLAASIVLALGLGFGVLRDRDSGVQDGALQSEQAGLLSSLPSGETFRGEGFSLTPQFSFISRDTRACRIYRMDEAEASHTRIACMEAGSWRLVDTWSIAAGADASDAYVPATASDAAVEERLDDLMAGAPLSREQEQDLLDNDWQAL